MYPQSTVFAVAESEDLLARGNSAVGRIAEKVLFGGKSAAAAAQSCLHPQQLTESADGFRYPNRKQSLGLGICAEIGFVGSVAAQMDISVFGAHSCFEEAHV